MKKKFLKTAAALAATAFCGMFTTCFAIDFIPLDGVYTIKGTAENIKANMLSVKVTGADGIAHASYIITDDSGNFSYSFTLSDEWSAGSYHAELAGYDAGTVFSYDFEHADSQKQKDIITALNTASGTAAAQAALEDCIKYYLISYPTSFDFTDKIKAEVYSRIADTTDFTKENLSDRLTEIFAVAALMHTSESEVDSVIAEFWDKYGFENEKYYDIYENSNQKSAMHKMFLKNRFNDMTSLRKIFNSIVILNKMNTQESHGGIVNVFNAYSDVMPESVNKLSESNKIKLALEILDKDIYTAEELDSEAKKIVPESNTIPGTGGGGGGSSSGRTQSSGISAISGGAPANISATPENSVNNVNKKPDFADMSGAEWARTAVSALIERSVLNGYDDGDFRPNNNITREEFVKIIVSAFGFAGEQSGCDFGDMPDSHWAYEYICTAKARGLINGISGSMFGTEQNITRQDMAVIIYNALNAVGISSDKPDGDIFADESTVAEYAKAAVHSLKAAGIISGYDDGSFRPENNATRAEAAQMIYNVLKYAGRI